jgi:hypothetical protein
MRAGRLLALKAPQGTDLVTLNRMDTWRSALSASNVQAPSVELDLMPSQVTDLGSSKAMIASRCPYRLDLRAAPISFSTSAPVRYSRVRPTEEFMMVGGVVLSASNAMGISIPDLRLRNY